MGQAESDVGTEVHGAQVQEVMTIHKEFVGAVVPLWMEKLNPFPTSYLFQ